MFDPKVLLDAILAGSAKPAPAPQQAPQANAVDLGEILRRMGQAQGGGAPQGGGGGGLAEILEKLGRAAGQPQGQGQGQGQAGGQPAPGGGGLGDILGEIFGRASQAPDGAGRPQGGPAQPGRQNERDADEQEDARENRGAPAQGRATGGRDLLEEIFGPQGGDRPATSAQAPSQPQAPARPVPPQTPQAPQPPQTPAHTPWGSANGGRGGAVIDVRQQVEDLLGAIAEGQGTPEMIQQLQELVDTGQVSAGAVIGGLGSVVVGNKPGRRIEAQAARMGGVELIGTIAYHAYLAFSQGRPPAAAQAATLAPPPAGSGFEPQAQNADAALAYVRAMIAAACADGEIDRAEQQQLVGGLEALGLGQNASQFLQQEIENPQSPADLIQAAGSPAIALQVYTAARLAIEPDTRDEQAFLQALAQGIGIDAKLAAHIDALTRSLKV